MRIGRKSFVNKTLNQSGWEKVILKRNIYPNFDGNQLLYADHGVSVFGKSVDDLETAILYENRCEVTFATDFSPNLSIVHKDSGTSSNQISYWNPNGIDGQSFVLTDFPSLELVNLSFNEELAASFTSGSSIYQSLTFFSTIYYKK